MLLHCNTPKNNAKDSIAAGRCGCLGSQCGWVNTVALSFGNNPLSEPLLLTRNTKAYIKHGCVKESWSDSLCSELSVARWNRTMYVCLCVCARKCNIKWCLTWRKLPFVMTWETISNRKKFTWKPFHGCLWGTSAIQDETDRRVSIGNTTLKVLVHFSDLKLRVLFHNIKSIKSKIANVQIFSSFLIWNTVFSSCASLSC